MTDRLVTLRVGGGDSQTERMSGAGVYAYTTFSAAVVNDGLTNCIQVKPLLMDNFNATAGASAAYVAIDEFGTYAAYIDDGHLTAYLACAHELWGRPQKVITSSWKNVAETP